MASINAPIQMLQQQQTGLNNQSSAIQSIESDVSNLMTAVNTLSNTTGEFNAVNATSSNSNVLTATADTTAAAQSHSITVSAVATTSSYYTSAVASSSTPITTGSFQLAIGTNAPVTITVDNTNNTLSGLATAINNQNLGVTASVIDDASGARLALVSNTSGAPGDLTVSNNTTGLTFNKAVTGTNASLTVDGVPVSATSNTVTGVIQGVTLSLASAAPGTSVSLSVAPDTSKASDAINAFVTAYNTVVKDINTQFNVLADGSGGGPLEGDGTLRLIQTQLLAGVNYAISGNNGFVNLSSLGINMNNDGTLSVDSAALSNSLSGNFTSVKNFFQGSNLTGFASTFWNTLNQINDPAKGYLALDLQGVTQTNQALTQQIADLQAIAATKQQALIAQFSQVEVTLQELPTLQSQISSQLGSIK
jgi:flagellar hook-associated protein 2